MQLCNIGGINILPLSYSFGVESDVTEAQKSVFTHFELPLNQEFENIPHGQWLGKRCVELMNVQAVDIVMFFDLDCVPLSPDLFKHLLSKVDSNTICGIEQTCESNKSNGHIYAGPACLAIPRNILQNVYRQMDRLCFTEDEYSDVAQRFTYDCEQCGVNVNFLRVTSCEDPRWRVGQTNTMFGVGTTYDEMIYHHFLIGREPWRRPDFIRKCNQIKGMN